MDHAQSLSVKSRRFGDVIVVTCVGRVVGGDEAAVLEQHITSLLPDNPLIVLNWHDVTYMDSGGVGLVVRFSAFAGSVRVLPLMMSTRLRMAHGLEFVKRRGQPLQSTIVSDEVEMEGRPVRQQEGLVALPVVCLEVAATGLAVVDAQAGFSLDGHDSRAVESRFHRTGSRFA